METWKKKAQLCSDIYHQPDRIFRGGIEYAGTGSGRSRAFTVCGTNGWRDWVYNLTAKKISVPGMGVVHLGFFLAMQKVIKDFLLFTAQKPADLCGHSAGAAIILQLAVYVSVMIPDGRQRIRNVCAVAPPKVGGAEFCETFRALFSDENCRLYTRRFDPVTKFPRGKYQHPYQHKLPSKADGKFDHPIDGYIDIIDE